MIKKIVSALLICTQVASAGLPPTTMQGQTDTSAKVKFQVQAPHNQVTDLGGVKGLIETGNSNIVPNPGFEASTVGWTASGGATSTANSTAKGTGAQGYDWDSNSASQTLVSATIVIPNGMKSNNGLLSCAIKTVSGTATHTMTVDDGTTNIVTPVTITSSTNGFVRTSVNFIYPSSGSIRVKFTSVAANEPEIYIDDCFLGDAVNIGTVAQAKLIGTIKMQNCASDWNTTSTTFASFATRASCTYTTTGDALAPTTNIPAIRFASLAPGNYKLEYEGLIESAGTTSYFQFYDGTNASIEESYVGSPAAYIDIPGINHSIAYTSPQSNVTLQIRAKVSGSTARVYGTATIPGVIRVYYYPSSSQQAIAMQNADYDWTSYGTTSDFTGFGTATSIQLQHKREGSDLLLRGKFATGTSTGTEARVALPNGLISSDTVRIPSIAKVGGFSTSYTEAYSGEVLIEPSTAYITFAKQGAATNGLQKLFGTQILPTSGQTLSFYARIPIQGWSTNQNAPILIGSVTSNSSGAERIERATVTANCTSSPCTIASQSGSWITSITRSSTGLYVANFASGTFSSAPTCVSTTANGDYSPVNQRLCNVGTTTSTTAPIACGIVSTNAVVDTGFQFICMGPR